jgi:hypothetical protein
MRRKFRRAHPEIIRDRFQVEARPRCDQARSGYPSATATTRTLPPLDVVFAVPLLIRFVIRTS